MRKYIKILFVLSTMFFFIHVNDVNVFAETNTNQNYERDYLSKVYNSENGLEGTTANCICPAKDGFLWLGGYTGLYRYDGTEFKKYLMDDRAIPVNDIVQDENGTLWIGTNGEGIYSFDGENFKEYKLDHDERGSSVINKLYKDSEGIVWIGTKAGLFSIDTRTEEKTVKKYDEFSEMLIQDISEIGTGDTIVLEKTGRVFCIDDENVREISISGLEGEGIPRCCSTDNGDTFYIGTTGNLILKMSNTGEVLEKIDGNGLSSFNEIRQLDENQKWVCSDNGIGILKDDKIEKMDFPFDDSVEESCEDYQGNYWFVSSREGILQLYENHFSDLESYWGGKRRTANSIQPYGDKIYVGYDEGLFCYEGKNQVTDNLVEACGGARIRQIYLDRENNLWVSTFEDGIKEMTQDGKIVSYNTENSGLGTDKIRCIWENSNQEFLVGTEDGAYIIDRDHQIKLLTDDNILSTKRILAIKEDNAGKIYVATDGYGIYEIEDGNVKKVYSKQDGLLSNVVMKLVPSEKRNGIWAVTGEGICFIDENEKVQKVTGIPVANSLDMLLNDDGTAVILAGNGYFQLNEKDLLKKENISYIHYDKKDGLPVDFTANARNTIQNGILYMCGTTGAVSINLNEEHTEKPIKLYINGVVEDGKDISCNGNEVVLSSGSHRVNIDVKMINFVHQNVYAGYFLKGMDKEETFQKNEDMTDISYTNLEGGHYTYHYKVYDGETDKCLVKLSVPIRKNYRFWEEPRARALGYLLGFGVFVLLFILLLGLREKRMDRHYQIKYLKEKEDEISKLAYRDLVTGVYNRNFFEMEKEKLDVTEVYAVLSVSINHMVYFKSKYGIFFTENIFRKGVEVMQQCTKEDIKIFRVSENIFYYWIKKPVQLETYIQEMKESFQKKGEEEGMPFSFSIGAIYNNTIGKENIDELIDRCGKMRLLDEKNAEAKFIEGKVKML